jgi:DNA polymerase III alpha subunit
MIEQLKRAVLEKEISKTGKTAGTYLAQLEKELMNYNDSKVYEFLKKGNLENIFENTLMSNWMDEFPLENLHDLRNAMFFSAWKNDYFVEEYIGLRSAWSDEKLNGDKRIHDVYDKTHGSLLYTEDVAEVMSIVFAINKGESHRIISELKDEYWLENKDDPKEFYARFIEAGLKNTTESKYILRHIASDVFLASSYCYPKEALMNRAKTAYQLAYFKTYHPEQFNKCFEKPVR